jgi:hypothetical protein
MMPSEGRVPLPHQNIKLKKKIKNKNKKNKADCYESVGLSDDI